MFTITSGGKLVWVREETVVNQFTHVKELKVKIKKMCYTCPVMIAPLSNSPLLGSMVQMSPPPPTPPEEGLIFKHISGDEACVEELCTDLNCMPSRSGAGLLGEVANGSTSG